MRFSALSKVAVTSLLLASVASVGFARTHHHMPAKEVYKDSFKDTVPCPALPSLMGGFYVGAQAGYDAYRLRNSVTDDGGSFSSINSATGWVGGLFLGYGQYFNDLYYLGGEVLGNYNGNSQIIGSGVDAAGGSFSNKVQAKGTWGLALIPGLKLNETTLGYIRLGYDWTNFQFNANGVVAGEAFSGSKSSTQGGFDFGLGLETLVYQNWSVRTEYNHVWYNSMNANGADVTGSVNPSDNQFTLGVVYHIG